MEKEFTEEQLVQMAQQQEAALMGRREILERLAHLMKENVEAAEALEELRNANGKILVKLGSGVLVEVEAGAVKKCKRTFSDSGFVEEDSEKTIEWLKKGREKIKKQLDRTQQEISQINSNLNDVISILRQIESEKRKLMQTTISK